MKQNLKNYLKLGILLFGISLMLVNCQNDDDFKNVKLQKASPYKISKINYKEVAKNHAVLGKLEAINQAKYRMQNQTANKTVYSTVYDFEINTDYVTYIESEDGLYHSYTFYIKRAEETSILENLMVSLQKDGSYFLVLVTYDTTIEEKEDLEDGKHVDLTNKVTYTKLDDEDLLNGLLSVDDLPVEASEKNEVCGVYHIQTHCFANNPDHPYGIDEDGNICPGWEMIITFTDCPTGDGGYNFPDGNTENPNTSGTTENPPNSNGTNNGGSDNDSEEENEDATSPTTTCTRDCPEEETEPDPIHEKNCEELDKLINNPYPGTTNPFT